MFASLERKWRYFVPSDMLMSSAHRQVLEGLRHHRTGPDGAVDFRIGIERDKGSAITWTRTQLRSRTGECRPRLRPPIPAFDRQCLMLAVWQPQRVSQKRPMSAVSWSAPKEHRIKGHNTLPHGVAAIHQNASEVPTNTHWVEHAERNAIYTAARAAFRWRDDQCMSICCRASTVRGVSSGWPVGSRRFEGEDAGLFKPNLS